MYRAYENPITLAERLEEAQKALAEANEAGDLDRAIEAHDTIEELKQRINFAYQDESEE